MLLATLTSRFFESIIVRLGPVSLVFLFPPPVSMLEFGPNMNIQIPFSPTTRWNLYGATTGFSEAPTTFSSFFVFRTQKGLESGLKWLKNCLKVARKWLKLVLQAESGLKVA